MTLNERRLNFVLNSAAGPVGRFLSRSGVKIETAAKALATGEKLVRTGRYRNSITWLLSNQPGLVLTISASGPARILEYGSPPHRIVARSKRALWWDMPNERGWLTQPAGGRPVRFVNHPGTRPYMILHRAVRQVLGGSLQRAAG